MSRLTATRAALDLIQSFEGFRARAARLPAGGFTIGFGHTATAREGGHITREQAEQLLLWDLRAVEDAIRRAVHAPLSQNQFDALVSFVFNIGIENFLGSDALRHINQGEPVAAALSMGLWRRGMSGGRLIVVDALVRRRAAEAALFLEPAEVRPTAPTPVLPPHADGRPRLVEPAAAAPTIAPADVAAGLSADETADSGPANDDADVMEPVDGDLPEDQLSEEQLSDGDLFGDDQPVTEDAEPDALDQEADAADGAAPDSADPVAVAERIRQRVEQILAQSPDPSVPLRAAPAPAIAHIPPAAVANDTTVEAPRPGGLTPFPDGADAAVARSPTPANDTSLTTAVEAARTAPEPEVIVLRDTPAVPDPLNDTPEARLARLRERIAGGGASVAPEAESGSRPLWRTLLPWVLTGGGLGALVVGLMRAGEANLFQVTNTPAPLTSAETSALVISALGLLAMVIGMIGLSDERREA